MLKLSIYWLCKKNLQRMIHHCKTQSSIFVIKAIILHMMQVPMVDSTLYNLHLPSLIGDLILEMCYAQQG